MKGDYLKCMWEYITGATRSSIGEKAHEAYKTAIAIAEKELKITHPIRLELALSYFVFYYEVIGDESAAC
jgi:14-3-3 protein epsilon